MLLGAVLVVALIAISAWNVWFNAHYRRIGREARAANGGRHTHTYWVAMATIVVLVALLAVLRR